MKYLVVTFSLLISASLPLYADYDFDYGDPGLQPAKEALQKEHYEKALELLLQYNRENPGEANALGLTGFALRKLDRKDESLDYYQQALAIQPKHLGSNEYLGELYLQMSQLDKAEERLAVIDSAFACIFGCKEYDKLKQAIEDYKKANKI